MSSGWFSHSKQYAKDHDITYSAALKSAESNRLYHINSGKTPDEYDEFLARKNKAKSSKEAKQKLLQDNPELKRRKEELALKRKEAREAKKMKQEEEPEEVVEVEMKQEAVPFKAKANSLKPLPK